MSLPLASQMLIGTGVGALSQWLGANQQQKFFNQMQERLTTIRSPEHLRQLFGEQRRMASPYLNDLQVGTNMRATSAARSVSAQGQRRGFGAVSGLQAEGAVNDLFMGRRQTESALALEQLKMAMAQQDSQARDVMGLLQTPYGAVSPAQSALAGGGVGLEAVQTANYFETLAGRRGSNESSGNGVG